MNKPTVSRRLGFCALALSLVAFSGPVHAGGLDEPVLEPVVIEAETVGSGHDILVPIMALVLTAAAFSASN